MSCKIILIKILPECYVNDFLDGNIYMNSNEFFTSIDSGDNVRFDQFEGADQCWQVKEISIANTEGQLIPIGGIKNPATYRHSNKDKLNILCMYAYSNQLDDYFDKLNLEFGSRAIIIKNANEFIKRMKAAANLTRKKLYHGPITYVKNTYHGHMGPFKKFDIFKYQNEFRFALTKGIDVPYIHKIGDIRDITIVCSSQNIPQIPKKA